MYRILLTGSRPLLSFSKKGNPQYPTKLIGGWLLTCSAGVVGMMSVGAYTRLSGSGLSMTKWTPTGSRLPSTDEAWLEEFEDYKKFPEYINTPDHLKSDMDDFKRIYFVEWFHRMLGRGLGVLFLVPWLAFSLCGKIPPGLQGRLAGMAFLGGVQGGVGWWMVKSGLDEPQVHMPVSNNNEARVSCYRLAFHLSMATLIHSLLFSTATDLIIGPSRQRWFSSAQTAEAARSVRKYVKGGMHALVFTLITGAFVAGNKSGFWHNTWPKLEDQWIPQAVTRALADGDYRKFFEDTLLTQFDHRLFAYLTLGFSVFSAVKTRRFVRIFPAPIGVPLACVPLGILYQVSHGIHTVTHGVTPEAGVSHQFQAVSLLSLFLYLNQALKT